MRIDLSKFKTLKEKLDYLSANKADIIELKKSALKFSDAFGLSIIEQEVIKTLNTSHRDDIASGVIKRTIIGNTYNWMDSHDDVHLDGLFGKSISERADKIWHFHDHEHKITAKVGTPERIYEDAVKWSDMGVNKAGKTQALFMDSLIKEDLNKAVFKAYVSGEIDQHSVGMRYVKIEFAANSPDDKEAFATWQKHIEKIGNKPKAEEQGYFFAVSEAKLIEISAVLEGSNSLTPTVHNITPEDPAGKSTVKSEPINYNYLLTNLKIK